MGEEKYFDFFSDSNINSYFSEFMITISSYILYGSCITLKSRQMLPLFSLKRIESHKKKKYVHVVFHHILKVTIKHRGRIARFFPPHCETRPSNTCHWRPLRPGPDECRRWILDHCRRLYLL